MALLLYIQFYFITIATILGTGILGLPVTLAHSGFIPFLVPFIGSYLMQCILMLVFTELLQIAYFHKMQQQSKVPHSASGSNVKFEALPVIENEHPMAGTTSANEDQTDDSDAPTVLSDEFDFESHLADNLDIPVVKPNLHMIGELFLNSVGAFCFDIVLGISFVSVLISYALAGSQAFADILGLNRIAMIPVFCFVLTVVVVFLQFLVQPVISLLTLIKGCMFAACVVITFLVGAKVDNQYTNDWSATGEPFLMGTVAIGGIINILPILFMRIRPKADQIRKLNAAVILGLTTCFFLNIMWCWTLLKIVPQTATCPKPTLMSTISPASVSVSSSMGGGQSSGGDTCDAISLEKSHDKGDISTIPLSAVIEADHPQYSIVSIFVEFFIMVSITVSYLTFGSAMHHMISGMVESFWETRGQLIAAKFGLKVTTNNEVEVLNFPAVSWIRSVLSIASFFAVFCVAMSHPKGFIKVLDRVTSLSQNLQNCVFVPMMLFVVKTCESYKNVQISFKLHSVFYVLYIFVAIFYGVAVAYDLVIWCQALLG
ncbi:uncharacterized protein LOC142350050 isoform X2 [Convolutriloba macropyga]|uniref:uncharacterized protein LOC142350050 isoform X2 n=1 Tax=Convolutriloba macropyga TaxID=536237 RepID=UPI003F51AE7A